MSKNPSSGEGMPRQHYDAGRKPTKAEALESWKEWHRKLVAALRLDFVERNATLAAIKDLVKAAAALREIPASEAVKADPFGWRIDKRIGMIAIYKGPVRNCLNGIGESPDCVFVGEGRWNQLGGEWQFDEAVLDRARRCFAAVTAAAPDQPATVGAVEADCTGCTLPRIEAIKAVLAGKVACCPDCSTLTVEERNAIRDAATDAVVEYEKHRTQFPVCFACGEKMAAAGVKQGSAAEPVRVGWKGREEIAAAILERWDSVTHELADGMRAEIAAKVVRERGIQWDVEAAARAYFDLLHEEWGFDKGTALDKTGPLWIERCRVAARTIAAALLGSGGEKR